MRDETSNKSEALASNLFFKNMLDSCSSMEILCNTDLKVEYVTPYCQQLTGYTPDEYYLNESQITEGIHPLDRERIVFFFSDFIQNDLKKDDTLCRIITKSSQLKYLKIVMSCFTEDCAKHGIRISLQEVSQQMRLQEELERKIGEQNFLSEISKLVVKPDLDIENIEFVLKKIGEYLGLDRIGALIYEEQPHQSTSVMKWDPYNLSATSEIDSFLKNYVLEHRNTDFVENNDRKILPYSMKGVQYHVHFEPIVLEGELKGVISFTNRNLSKIEDQLELIRYTSRQVQNAIQLNYSNHKLEVVRKKLNMALGGAKAGVWEYEVKTGRLFMFESWKKMMRGSIDHDIENIDQWLEQIHPDDRQRVCEMFEQFISSNHSKYEFEYRYISAYNTPVWVLERGLVMERDAQGKPSKLIGVNINISERKQAEEMIHTYRKELERLLKIKSIRMKKNDMLHEAIVENLPAMVCRWKEDTSIVYANTAYADLIGVEREKLIGIRWIHSLQGEDLINGKTAVEYVISEKKVHTNLVRVEKNNKVRWINWMMYPVKDESGEIMEYQSIGMDVTEIQEAHLAMIEAKEKAEAADRLKTEFLNNMSHELRTPLNAVIGFSELLDKESSSEEVDEYSKFINSSGQELLHIIDQLMDITLIESNQMDVYNKAFDLRQMMSDVHLKYLLSPAVVDGQIQLKLRLPNNEEQAYVESDVALIRKSMYCLMENALKFTENGEVELGYIMGQNNRLELFVKDTGMGIPADQHDVIFERFRQIDGSCTRKFGGMGIGLFLTKHYMGLMNGNIQLKSECHKGSEFRLQIPINQKNTSDIQIEEKQLLY
ncbi:MAG: PAS domain-containing protein [Bacteroidales bacterium]|nr:PAS domain-containing protein [Bacteroidales bacterium]